MHVRPVARASSDRLTLTVAEAAELLGISRGLAYELAARGELPVLRLGRRIVIPRKALEALVETAGLSTGTGEAGRRGGDLRPALTARVPRGVLAADAYGRDTGDAPGPATAGASSCVLETTRGKDGGTRHGKDSGGDGSKGPVGSRW